MTDAQTQLHLKVYSCTSTRLFANEAFFAIKITTSAENGPYKSIDIVSSSTGRILYLCRYSTSSTKFGRSLTTKTHFLGLTFIAMKVEDNFTNDFQRYQSWSNMWTIYDMGSTSNRANGFCLLLRGLHSTILIMGNGWFQFYKKSFAQMIPEFISTSMSCDICPDFESFWHFVGHQQIEHVSPSLGWNNSLKELLMLCHF